MKPNFKDINIKDSIKGSITIKEFFNKDEFKISTIKFSDFLLDESGMGVVEILLITVVLIAMVLIFQEKITSLVNKIWTSIGKSAKKIY